MPIIKNEFVPIVEYEAQKTVYIVLHFGHLANTQVEPRYCKCNSPKLNTESATSHRHYPDKKYIHLYQEYMFGT